MTTVRGRPTNLAVQRKRDIQRARAGDYSTRRKKLPEYLDPMDIETLIELAPSQQASLMFLIQWRAGLRVSEALSLTKADFLLHDVNPVLRVRAEAAKGGKERVVPVHSELARVISSRWIAASNGLLFPSTNKNAEPGATVVRQTGHRWLKDALRAAVRANSILPNRKIGTHTLRHSAARHWPAAGVPINKVSRWLGHANLQTTLIYLDILPDASGDMHRVP